MWFGHIPLQLYRSAGCILHSAILHWIITQEGSIYLLFTSPANWWGSAVVTWGWVPQWSVVAWVWGPLASTQPNHVIRSRL